MMQKFEVWAQRNTTISRVGEDKPRQRIKWVIISKWHDGRRAVRMRYQRLMQAYSYWRRFGDGMLVCEHEDCHERENLVSCYLPDSDQDGKPDNLFCTMHASRAGFCYGCGTFWGGVESFDFGPGLCEHCILEVDDWDDDSFDQYDPFDEYDDHDWDDGERW